MEDTHSGHNGVLVVSLVVREFNREAENVQIHNLKMGVKIAKALVLP